MCRKCSLGVTIFLLASVAVGCIIFSVLLAFQHEISSGPQLSHRGDTVFLQSISRFYHSSITTSTCDQRGDSPHIDRIFIVPENNLTMHHTNHSLNSAQIDQQFSSAVSGLIDNLYLLEGSDLSYKICVGSIDSGSLQGDLFVFTNDFNFIEYKESPELGEQLSIISKSFEIGRDNSTNCVQLVFKAPKSSYYFVATRTPASIFYTFQYTLHINYYDHSDYQVACSIYEEEPCEITLPGSIFSTEKYVLLAYVRPNVELSSSTNHLCVTANRSDSVYLIIGMATSIAALALLGTVVIIIVVVVGIRRRNRRGYAIIQSSPPSYNSHYGKLYG